ncbi:lyase [Caulobacter radicis]|uniref:HEAT repeat domain-containing protein n=1 Tax=Caulobacter radicis TaxID=2172650 RepID=UPI000D581B90|nr:HEAT repeat domain-containing protein [Caulobacter radicis]PVM92114.1 lyase [Caulobacter radicis]
MSDRYEPTSDFLKLVIAEQAPLSGAKGADENLRRLIALTADADRSNRDWAVLLLSQEEVDGPEVREALLRAAEDEDDIVRAEAMLGLAQRDANLALPFVQAALAAEAVAGPALEAAALCAHPSLVADLKVWAEPSDEAYIDALAADALAACEAAASPPE